MNIKKIKHNLEVLIKKAVPELPSNFSLEVQPPPQLEMGDLSLSCFKIAQKIKEKPDEVSLKIEKKLKEKIPSINIIEKIKAVGPYLNIFLNKSIWSEVTIKDILKDKIPSDYSRNLKNKKVLIEYSAPNTNKPQHLGHLRNNFLGWTISELFSEVGAKVNKINLVNDRGIHICKSMLAYQKWGENKTPESEKIKGDHFVGKYYVLFDKEAKNNPGLLDEAQEMLNKWEQGDPEIIALWQKMNQWAIKGLKETYQAIKVDFDHWYFESDIYKLGKKIVEKGLKKNLCYKREDQAVEIDLEKYGLGKKVLLRSDKTSVYITQDIGLAYLKQKQFNPDLSIYVVASEQNHHFKVLFKVLEIFGFKKIKNLHHLSYGLVFLPQGKMKSREGETADADDIIKEMKKIAKREVLSRNSNLSPIELSSRAEIISLAAIKFFLLRFTPEQEINFDPKASISFKGDTGPYCQYTYARIKSILKKSKKITKKEKEDYKKLGNNEEIGLIKLLFNYPEIIEKSVNNHNPSYLAHYLLEVAQKFNEFYHQHPVLKAEPKTREARLKMIMATAKILKKGLKILGIEVLEEM